MITRSDYLAGKASHVEYYAQFVTPAYKARVRNNIGLDKLLRSQERFYSDVAPLNDWDRIAQLIDWDRIAQPHPSFSCQAMVECGDYMTQAGAVCILKEAARQLVEEYLQGLQEQIKSGPPQLTKE
jgi:hypothetical protein